MAGLIFVLLYLVVLKATGLATMSLTVMFSPIWIAAVVVLCFVIAGCLHAVYEEIQRRRAKMEREARKNSK